MSPTHLSPQHVVKLTSRIVAAFCKANRLAADDLPGVIAAIGQKVGELHNVPLLSNAEEPGEAKLSRTAIPLRGADRTDRSLARDHVRSRIRSVLTAPLGNRRLATSNIQAHAINPKAVAAVSSAYQDAMAEITRASGYLPSRSRRGLMAEKMIAAAEIGEWNPGRLKEAGLAALRDDNVVPLSLAIAARLRLGSSSTERNRPLS
jgi:hypothetical protein